MYSFVLGNFILANRSYNLKVIKELYAKSGNRCAFPGCNEPLFDESSANISNICHVSGLEPNSPRYNPYMTDEERNSISNLILLCENHHKLVDSQPHTYTVEVLTSMKNKHEYDVFNAMAAVNTFYLELQKIFSKYDFDIVVASQVFDVPFPENYMATLENGCFDIKKLLNTNYALQITAKERTDIVNFTELASVVLTQVSLLYYPNGNGIAVIHNNTIDYTDKLNEIRQLMYRLQNMYSKLRYR